MQALADIAADSRPDGRPHTLGELVAVKLEELKRLTEMRDAEYDLAMACAQDLRLQLDAMRKEKNHVEVK